MRNRSLFAGYFIFSRFILDIILIPLIFILSYVFKFKLGYILRTVFLIPFGTIYTHTAVESYIPFLGLITFVWVVSFYFSKLYRSFYGFMSIVDEFFTLIKAIFIATIQVMAITFLFPTFPESRYVIFYSMCLGILVLGGFRLFLHFLEVQLLRKGIGTKNTLVIGHDSFAQDVVERLLLIPSLGLNYVGNLTIVTPKKLHFNIQNRFKSLGDYSQYKEIVETYQIHTIFVVDTTIKSDQLLGFVLFCEERNMDIKVLSDFSTLLPSSINLIDFDGLPFQVHSRLPEINRDIITKRLFDFFVSAILFLLLLPLFIVIGVLIKIVSPKGPVFFVQERVGKNGKLFNMIKFRTMHHEAEHKTGPVMVDETGDSRCIPFGTFLRKRSLDELPQLINVLKGEMSLVGPRPERQFFVDEFSKEVPYFSLRHRVLGGITGWAQVNGRSVLTSRPEQKTRYDLYYIKNWSFIFDLKIIFKTFLIVIKGEEAY